MDPLPDQLEIVDVPRHVQSWTVAHIPGFVLAVLQRWQRHHGELPHEFSMVMCPQVEINARGGLPDRVTELTDPRLRCRHFTGCHRPYFVVLFTGPQAGRHREEVQEILSWSEAYTVSLGPRSVVLTFAGATEDQGEEPPDRSSGQRTLKRLLESGELISILS